MTIKKMDKFKLTYSIQVDANLFYYMEFYEKLRKERGF